MTESARNAFNWPGGARAAVSLSFDDARASQAAYGLAALDVQNVKATFYVSLPAMRKHLDAWKSAVAAGHEIGNHTQTHPCSGNYEWSRTNALEDYTLERMSRDIESADDEIYRLLDVRPTTFAYPCGQQFIGRGAGTQSYVPLIAGRFKVGRGFNGTTVNDPAFVDLAQTLGVDMDGKSFDDLTPLLDMAIARGAWLVLVGHEIGTDRARQTTLLPTIEAICQFCAASNIWIDTIDAVASHIVDIRNGQ